MSAGWPKSRLNVATRQRFESIIGDYREIPSVYLKTLENPIISTIFEVKLYTNTFSHIATIIVKVFYYHEIYAYLIYIVTQRLTVKIKNKMEWIKTKLI